MNSNKVTAPADVLPRNIGRHGLKPVVWVVTATLCAIISAGWYAVHWHGVNLGKILDITVGTGAAVVIYGAFVKSRASWHRLSRLSDWLALKQFDQTYGDPDLSGVAVIIPALNERSTLAQTLSDIPPEICGLKVHALVVSDGSNDDTPEVASQSGAYVCDSPLTRGQGAALRLGYHLAERHHAQYIVTLDADGQYVPAEMENLLRPLIAGEADFVQGSRRLGTYESESRIRIAGMYLFGWVIRVLTHHRITDSSNGFRAIRIEVLRRLALNEDQYHASELLMGAIFKGYQVIECPVTMLRRKGGKTKKGRPLLYGFHYARVILGTWLKEG